MAPGQEFTRDTNYVTTRITRDGRDGFPVEAGRYRLIAARACPWANRTIIVRRLLGLEDAISMGLTGPTHDQRSWTFDLDPGGVDPVLGYERLQQAYFARDPGLPAGHHGARLRRRDRPRQLVTNDFAQMTLDMSTEWTEFHREGAPDLYPEHLRDEMDAGDEARSSPRSTTASTAAASPARRRRTTRRTTGCSPRWTGWRSGSPPGAT